MKRHSESVKHIYYPTVSSASLSSTRMSQTTLADTPDQPTALTNFTPTEGDDNELQKLDVGKDDIESNPSGPSTVAENKVMGFPLK